MKAISLFFSVFRRLTFKKTILFLRLVIPCPLLAGLSFYAALKALSIAKKHFPVTNPHNGRGNAFRHALWCCLIMMYCCKISSPKKALIWCKKVTDLHEELFPNKPLETKMDLHNNKVGMDVFMEMLKSVHRQFFETSFFVEILLQKTKTAKILQRLNEEHGRELVFLSE